MKLELHDWIGLGIFLLAILYASGIIYTSIKVLG